MKPVKNTVILEKKKLGEYLAAIFELHDLCGETSYYYNYCFIPKEATHDDYTYFISREKNNDY